MPAIVSSRRQRLAALANRVLGRYGLRIVRAAAIAEEAPAPVPHAAPPSPEREPQAAPAPPDPPGWGGRLAAAAPVSLSPELAGELRRDNPRLLDLRRRYNGHPASAHSIWSESYVDSELDLQRFRADNAYMWQSRDYDERPTHELTYVISALYARWVDRLGLLDRLGDDGAFGNVMVEVGPGWTVSRDLLDSVIEIDFLDRHLAIAAQPDLELLDIGAGYGRLAHRLTQALPNVSRVICTDAVAESTFLSEVYLRFREAHERTEVVALDEITERLSAHSITVASNICSFPECPLAAITWWVDLLAASSIPYLFIVANTTALESSEPDGSRLDFVPLLRSRGYERVALEPKFSRSPAVQQYGIFPAQYHLYHRSR